MWEKETKENNNNNNNKIISDRQQKLSYNKTYFYILLHAIYPNRWYAIQKQQLNKNYLLWLFGCCCCCCSSCILVHSFMVTGSVWLQLKYKRATTKTGQLAMIISYIHVRKIPQHNNITNKTTSYKFSVNMKQPNLISNLFNYLV